MSADGAGGLGSGDSTAFVVDPMGWYAIVSIHPPTSRPKLDLSVPALEVNWPQWGDRLLGLEGSMIPFRVSCHDGIVCWYAGGGHNPYGTMMVQHLTGDPHAMAHGVAMFAGAVGVQYKPTGLTADQLGTLAAAYRRAAQQVSPKLYGEYVG